MAMTNYTRYFAVPFEPEPPQPTPPVTIAVNKDLVCYWLPKPTEDGISVITLFLANRAQFDVVGPF